MGLITQIMSFLFGDGRNTVAQTVEVFRENAEKGAVRATSERQAALAQFAAEFTQPNLGRFDRFVDGLNRLPRPMLAIGTIALFVSAMTSPDWFTARMAGIQTVPEPLWWLMGVVVSFYFGARHQVKGQQFQREVMKAAAAKTTQAPVEIDAGDNAALRDWQASQ